MAFVKLAVLVALSFAILKSLVWCLRIFIKSDKKLTIGFNLLLFAIAVTFSNVVLFLEG